MLCARALSQRDAVNCVKPLSIAVCDATTAVVTALFSIVLFMSRFMDLITSKNLVNKTFATRLANR